MANVGALQVILSSSLALIDSVFLCAVVNFDFFTFFDCAMLVSVL